jgi:heme/copper-type cytochrome/quinol oxidase subunit 2
MATPLGASTALKAFLVATVVVVAAAVLTTLPARAGGHPAGYPITIDVRTTAKGDWATPFNFAVQPGRAVEVRVRNYTRELHTFAIPAIGLNVAVLPGTSRSPRTVTVRFVVPRYGVYEWYCVTCRLGMHMHNRMGGKVYAWISPDLAIG